MRYLLFNALILSLISCNGQTNTRNQQRPPVGGGCDGCEIMYVGMPKQMDHVDTSAGWTEPDTRLQVNGSVLKLDGKTPAADIIIYYWQTDNTGKYTPVEGMDKTAARHGHLRGWVKTNEKGEFRIYTVRPAPYPKEDLPAHIHFSIKEPEQPNEYYTDDLVFEDDPLLAPYYAKHKPGNRGGNGIVKTKKESDREVVEHRIVLGLNIQNYR